MPTQSRSDRAGLTAAEASQRLAVHGLNQIAGAVRSSIPAQVREQLRDPMILVLLLAAALTVATGDRPDTVVILLVVAMNTTVGIVQHRRAEEAMAALGALAPQEATVRRDDLPTRIPAVEVVPGDLVLLAGGDVVPADGLLAVAEGLTLDESAMTGESLPVARLVGEEVTAGTLVVRGRGELVVTATGAGSGLGLLASMVHDAPSRRTPLQDRMRRLSAALVALVLSLTVLVVVLGLLRGEGLVEMLVVGASLAVAAVPESLPAVMTVALATGAHRMAQRSAVVRRLSAVETLGSVTVIATDKTGTLTVGSLSVAALWSAVDAAPGEGDDTLLRDLVLCNDASTAAETDGRGQGDPLELAILARADAAGYDHRSVRASWLRCAELPFDAATQQMTTAHRCGGAELTVVKGAPEQVLPLVGDVDRERARAIADRWAAEGQRVLAVAHADCLDLAPAPGSMGLAGLVAFADPPRSAAAAVVQRCREAGIRVVLVTGDHLLTARSVARQVGIIADPEDDAAGTAVFARVAPVEKVGIVEALQAGGEVVAMLGDGVNDAPALKRSDIGVAAGRGGTEVARQAADVVLLDDDLSTVVAAIEEGRRIFANLRSFLVYAVSGGLSEVAVMLVGPFLGIALPLLPSQILWINLLTHGLTGVAFSGEPGSPDAMRAPPVPRDAPVLTRRHVVVLGTAAALLTATSLAVALVVGGGQARTAAFVTLGLGQLGVALALRASRTGAKRSPGLVVSVAVSAVLMLCPLVVAPLQSLLGVSALSGAQLGLAVGAALVPGLLVSGLRRLGVVASL
ncbi:cation-translocating P-type ATPase [Nocardioides cynanchi]|uniref:cation-translocating P-type ATPase n=1 Tax=Nocardioides cynanchi TaxID=2558918 RepID=UPI0012459A3D|nr:cation-transporting P-type ATPase [Nocardioides cynanchi]